VLSTESAGEYSSAAKGETLEGAHSCCCNTQPTRAWLCTAPGCVISATSPAEQHHLESCLLGPVQTASLSACVPLRECA
jgi:hypothetical protein